VASRGWALFCSKGWGVGVGGLGVQGVQGVQGGLLGGVGMG
jgi:hypothetical protein